MNVLVFKTNVLTETEIFNLAPALNNIPGQTKWNFDLEDCDKILRIECTENFNQKSVIALLVDNGFTCRELES